VAECAGLRQWDLAYQSRSGAPNQAWLEPDILDYLRKLNEEGVKNVLVAPLGFVSDHVEVLYDLDIEAQELASSLGMKMVRAPAAGTHPAFVRMLRQLISERISGSETKLSIGVYGASHDVCLANCCPAPLRVGKPAALATPAALQQL
jgi:ferrochelatase